MTSSIFYSWQSDLPNNLTRGFIEDALERAIRQLSAQIAVDEAARDESISIDKDTKGVPGSPPIVQTIFDKISAATAFVPDLTFVGKSPNGRLIPNPNVLIEYGWALKELGHSKIVGVMNAAYGEVTSDSLPFDMRHLRWPIVYKLPLNASSEEKLKIRELLVKEFCNRLRPIIDVARNASEQGKMNEVSFDKFTSHFGQIHETRNKSIGADKGYQPLLDGGILVIHINPLSAFGGHASPSFNKICSEPHRFVPINTSRPRDHKITYDGLITVANGDGVDKPQRAYVHVSRSGGIEAVASSLTDSGVTKYLQLPNIQAAIIKYVHLYMTVLASYDITPPYIVSVSLLNVDGVRLLQDFRGTAFPEDLPFNMLVGDSYKFGEVVIQTQPQDYRESARMLRPILDHMANAAGLPTSPYFDLDGKYELDL
jgi:hypothetical protein